MSRLSIRSRQRTCPAYGIKRSEEAVKFLFEVRCQPFSSCRVAQPGGLAHIPPTPSFLANPQIRHCAPVVDGRERGGDRRGFGEVGDGERVSLLLQIGKPAVIVSPGVIRIRFQGLSGTLIPFFLSKSFPIFSRILAIRTSSSLQTR